MRRSQRGYGLPESVVERRSFRAWQSLIVLGASDKDSDAFDDRRLPDYYSNSSRLLTAHEHQFMATDHIEVPVSFAHS